MEDMNNFALLEDCLPGHEDHQDVWVGDCVGLAIAAAAA
jgi:hypothetical protein